MQILHIARFVEFLLGKHVPDVAPHHGAIAAEKFGHLVQAKPDGLPVESDLHFSRGGLIDRDLGQRTSPRNGLARKPEHGQGASSNDGLLRVWRTVDPVAPLPQVVIGRGAQA